MLFLERSAQKGSGSREQRGLRQQAETTLTSACQSCTFPPPRGPQRITDTQSLTLHPSRNLRLQQLECGICSHNLGDVKVATPAAVNGSDRHPVTYRGKRPMQHAYERQHDPPRLRKIVDSLTLLRRRRILGINPALLGVPEPLFCLKHRIYDEINLLNIPSISASTANFGSKGKTACNEDKFALDSSRESS